MSAVQLVGLRRRKIFFWVLAAVYVEVGCSSVCRIDKTSPAVFKFCAGWVKKEAD